MSAHSLDPRQRSRYCADFDAIRSAPGVFPLAFVPRLLVGLPVFVVSMVVHECAHGLVALAHGDPTARDSGRLTLDPLRHVDLVGSLLVPGLLLALGSPFTVGWARQMPVDRA